MTSGARLLIAGYALAVAALCLVLGLQLLPILFAGLLVYSVVGALAPGLQRHVPGVYAHRLVVAVLAVLVVGVLTLAIVAAIAYLGSENGNPARFFERMTPLIERARTQLPSFVVDRLPERRARAGVDRPLLLRRRVVDGTDLLVRGVRELVGGEHGEARDHEKTDHQRDPPEDAVDHDT